MPMPERKRCFQTRKLPCVGTKTPASSVRSGSGSGKRSVPSLVEPGLGHRARQRRLGRAQALLELRPATTGLGLGERRAERGDVVARDAAAAADDLRALVAPAEREPGVGLGADRVVEAPALAGEMAEVRVDAERHLGEVAQPRDDSRHVVDRQAVDQQGVDAHLLEAPGGAAEEVALGRAPVLAVDAAHAMAAAAVREPDGQAGLEQQLDHLVGRGLADQRQRLEQEHVGRIVLEHPREQLDRLAACRRVDLLGDRERDRAVLLAPCFLRWPCARAGCRAARCRSSGSGRRLREPRALLGLGRREDRPRRGREHVAARCEMPAVDVEHGLGRLVERPGAPQLLIGLRPESRCTSVSTPPSRITQRSAPSSVSTCRYPGDRASVRAPAII